MVHHRKKLFVFVLLIGVIFGTAGAILLEKSQGTFHRESSLQISPYPGFSWSKPIPYQTAVLLTSKKDTGFQNEVSNGMLTFFQSQENISAELFAYFDSALSGRGFIRTDTVKIPPDGTYWIAEYLRKNKEYVEIQYFPSPDQDGFFKLSFFYGPYPFL